MSSNFLQKFKDKTVSLNTSYNNVDNNQEKKQNSDLPVSDNLDSISCYITYVIFRSADGNFTVYAVTDSNGKNFNVQTNNPIVFNKKDKIIIKGSWSSYKGNPVFKASVIQHDIAKGAKGIITWLGTKVVTGVGKSTAEKIGRHFGDRLEEVIGNPDELSLIIPRNKAEAIAEAWNMNAGQSELVAYLGKFGIGELTIAKIIKRYGSAAKRVVRDNPWSLAENISGIGFVTADNIALEAGHQKDSVIRIEAGVKYSLEDEVNKNGHIGLPLNKLLEVSCKLLGISRDLVSNNINNIIDNKFFFFDETSKLICPASILNSEINFCNKLKSLMAEGTYNDVDASQKAIDMAMEKLNVSLDEGQYSAAVMAVANPVSIITGGPGTGKSTTQRVIVKALELMDYSVVLAAPTGRAAKRLSEVSNREAFTCHRLLQFSMEKGGFEYDENKPFEQDKFIVDEFSMVDIRLGSSFSAAIKRSGGLIIVGDVDQLPSVGPGQVLKDIINSEVVPVSRLTKVHRQAENSGIVKAAWMINNGKNPIEEQQKLNGFDFKEVYSSDDMKKYIVSLMTEILPAQGYDPIKHVQVLSSMRKGDLGVNVLNEVIKDALNPANKNPTVEIRKRIFSVGDRVMHLKNDYVKKVYNGEVGTVVWAGNKFNSTSNKEEPCFKVDYSGYEVFYYPSDVEDVELSWAATVHKSQGCEFPVVIFVCPNSHKIMLTKNLLYTAVTRSKDSCYVVGHSAALEHAVRTISVNKRFTGLNNRLSNNVENELKYS